MAHDIEAADESDADRQGTWLLGVGIVVATLLATLLLLPLRRTVDNTATALLLVLIVVAAASTGVRWAGILAALSGAFWFDLFSTKPYGELSIHKRNDVIATVLLLVIGVAVSELAAWGQRQRARADRRAGYLRGVVRTAEIVALSQEDDEELTEHVAEQIKDVLGVTHCRYVAGPVTDVRTPVLGHEGAVSCGGHLVDVDRDGLPTDFETAVVVSHEGVPIGSFRAISAAKIVRPSREQRLVAVLLADQVSNALGA